jgi:hypothetical protein
MPVVPRIPALLGACVAIAGTISAWLIHNPYDGAVASDTLGVGTCHAFATEVEATNWSDVAPPVACDGPHQTETYFVGELPVGGDAQRPDLEALSVVARGLCTADDLNAFMGAKPGDDESFLGIWTRFPTPVEWQRGDRTYRCDVSPSAPAGQLPTLTTSLHDILQSHAGDAFRRCFDDQDVVPCSAPHTGEHIQGWIPVPAGVDAGAISPNWGAAVCDPRVSSFLGTDVSRTKYLVTAVAVPKVTPPVAECRVSIPPGAAKLTRSLSATTVEKR